MGEDALDDWSRAGVRVTDHAQPAAGGDRPPRRGRRSATTTHAGDRSRRHQDHKLTIELATREWPAAVAAFAKGIRSWREQMLGYFEKPITNGNAEGVINKVKVIKRRAYGLPHLPWLLQTRRHSLWLTGQRDATPLNQQEPTFRPALTAGDLARESPALALARVCSRR
jgi:Transposase